MFKRIWEAFKAWRRGDRRVAAKGVRGRVYARRDEPAPPGRQFGARATATCEVRVKRADGTVEIHQVPASVEAQPK